jgi:predicted DNA-binding ribbon-helix-helix protein
MSQIDKEVSVMKSIPCTLRLEEEMYTRIKMIARERHTSFTAFVQGVLADVLKKEEQKSLYAAFSQAGDDADVEYAMAAQLEVIELHE